MPTYQYVCSKCDLAFELVQSMKDEALTVCPKHVCAQKRWGRGTVKRQISSGGGLLFKGSGFYITDYRSEGYKQSAKKESDAAAPKKEAAPAAKTETAPAKPKPAAT